LFNVALIDIQLPDMKGTTLLSKLKETAGPKMIKIIITGHPDLKNAVDAVNKGADGYIFKPIDFRKLLETIHDRLNQETEEYIKSHITRLHSD